MDYLILKRICIICITLFLAFIIRKKNNIKNIYIKYLIFSIFCFTINYFGKFVTLKSLIIYYIYSTVLFFAVRYICERSSKNEKNKEDN